MSGVSPHIEFINQRQMRAAPLEEFRPGDTVRVSYEIVEGDKKRVQVFQGVVIRIKGRKTLGALATFTVRKVSYGIGVERTFPYHSPRLVKIEVVTRGKVRKSRLFYMRSLTGKSARIQERSSGPRDAAAPAEGAPAEGEEPADRA